MDAKDCRERRGYLVHCCRLCRDDMIPSSLSVATPSIFYPERHAAAHWFMVDRRFDPPVVYLYDTTTLSTRGEPLQSV